MSRGAEETKGKREMLSRLRLRAGTSDEASDGADASDGASEPKRWKERKRKCTVYQKS